MVASMVKKKKFILVPIDTKRVISGWKASAYKRVKYKTMLVWA